MLKQYSVGRMSTTLLIGIAVAFLLALFIVLVFILPAEYGKDPTGLGEKFGLNEMSMEPRTVEDSSNIANPPELQSAAEADNTEAAHTSHQPPFQFMQTKLAIAGDGSVEYKFDMQAGNTIHYTWSVSDGGLAYADLHGHTPGPGGAPEGEILVHYLDTQEANTVSGTFTAPFDGEHGWYFLNLEAGEITITVQASGHWDHHKMLAIEPLF